MEEWRYGSHAFLTSALNGGEWSASRSGRFTLCDHWAGCWVCPRAGLDAVVKGAFPAPGGMSVCVLYYGELISGALISRIMPKTL
jgi:hypothetical protein